MRKKPNMFIALILILNICVIMILIITSYTNNGEGFVRIKDLTVVSEKGSYDQKAENQSNFIVILTNQSFENSKVNLAVYIDGNELISQDCKTENQHKGYYYYYNLVGSHDIKVVSEDGNEVNEEITFDKNKPIWVMASYWSEEEGANVQLNIMDRPFLWD